MVYGEPSVMTHGITRMLLSSAKWLVIGRVHISVCTLNLCTLGF